LKFLQIKMTLLKTAFPMLLALLLVINLTAAADDDEVNDNRASTTAGPDIWFGKECTISDAKNTRNRLYMTTFWTGRMVSYKRFSKSKKEAKWLISPVKTAGKTFFEIKNVDRKTYIAPFSSKGRVAGNFEKFSKSDKTNVLWTIDPPKQGVPVYIKNYKGQYLNQPKKSGKKRVNLSNTKRTMWIINCN
jgi:hypothetical protein